ncbi:MAG: hypothetical protein H0X36_11345 [Sphingomonadaceae bacterium]|nr:hypothetical protein [Sphingomonadaceae bacterium]
MEIISTVLAASDSRHRARRPLGIIGWRIRVLDIVGMVDYWHALEPLWMHLPLDFALVNLGVEACGDAPFRIRIRTEGTRAR